MKIYLTQAEKKQLRSNGRIVINREPSPARTSKSSILNGIGTNEVWDKVDRVWIFGDTNDYITKMKNVGRRAVDYPNNGININSGGKWWELDRNINEFGNVGETQVNGRVSKIKFLIVNCFISELKPDKEDNKYNRVNFKFTLELQNN